MSDKAVPVPTPETQRFWDGCAAGELWIQHCDDCSRYYFYPRPSCPNCGSLNVRWAQVSGRAKLYSYIISHRAAVGYENELPYTIAVVELEEGPRMTTNIVGVDPDPEQLTIDMPLEVTFEQRGDVSLPMFRPAEAGAR